MTDYQPCIYIGDWQRLSQSRQCELYQQGYQWTDGRNICAHQIIGGYPLSNPCQQDGRPVISNVAAVHEGGGTVRISWTQNIAGSTKILMNGVNIWQQTYRAGDNYFLIGEVTGTKTFCVEAV